MTSGNEPNRLDRIEQNISDLLIIARSHETRISDLVAVARSQESQFSDLLATSRSQESRLSEVETLTERNSQAIAELVQLQRQIFDRHESEMDSIKASLERIDRIMDYLLRQQGGEPV